VAISACTPMMAIPAPLFILVAAPTN